MNQVFQEGPFLPTVAKLLKGYLVKSRNEERCTGYNEWYYLTQPFLLHSSALVNLVYLVNRRLHDGVPEKRPFKRTDIFS